MRGTLAAIRHLEQAVLGAEWTEGIVLRYGAFYGPGTSLAPGEAQFEVVRRRKFPLVGGGGGVWSFVHIADAAEATVAAVEHAWGRASGWITSRPYSAWAHLRRDACFRVSMREAARSCANGRLLGTGEWRSYRTPSANGSMRDLASLSWSCTRRFMRLVGGVHHVTFLTEDIDRLASFYERIFDASKTLDMTEEGVRHVFLAVGSTTVLHPFEIIDAPALGAPPRKTVPPREQGHRRTGFAARAWDDVPARAAGPFRAFGAFQRSLRRDLSPPSVRSRARR
jgi:catechol 2,3-dioxygenase-like lactoylglutathione lyase family enzyme